MAKDCLRTYSWFLITFLICLIGYNKNRVKALSAYHLGRYRYGFLGPPSKTPSLQSDDAFPDLWFYQPLNHFANATTSTPTWKQRYFVNKNFYRNDSTAPIFLLIGGEAEASKRWMSEGAWIRYAEQFGALCFQLEHRFYGKSHPTSDLSNENLKYLNSRQGLADLIEFVKGMKKAYNLALSQKWVTFGGSYPGSLAAWVREKYPDLIHGAISSSGPLLAKVDFIEYYKVVKDSLRSYSEDCVKAVRKGFIQIDILLKHMLGQHDLDKKFTTCTPIKDSISSKLDISNFFENIASNFAGVVQYNKDNSPHNKVTIDEICRVMVNTSIGPPVSRLSVVNNILLSKSDINCLDFKYDKMIKEFKNTSWSSEAAKGMRQWMWQTCNEFGFYQTSENETSTFGDRFNLGFFIQQCMDIFEDSMDLHFLNQMINRTNKLYGGLKPSTTNVLYVHGSIDPWHALGLIKKNNPKTPTIYIKGTAHCADMYEPAQNDSFQLKIARNEIVKYLAKLLDQYRIN